MKNVLLSTACTAAIFAAGTARSEEARPAPEPDVAGKVSELVVTATRSPQPADRIGQSLTVLDEEAIRSSQSVVVSDLLTQTAGVAYSRNGGVGGVTSLRIRGAETDQTVVVVDGVKLNDPSSPGGGYNFANLLVGDVSRIEVLRGAQSTLWGSQAIGGVVNVVTAQPRKALEGSLQVEGGSQDTVYARGAIGGAMERLTWRLAAGRYTTQGVSSYRLGAEDDGYRNTQFSGRARLELTDDASLDLRALYSKGRNEYDGFPPPVYAFADTTEYGVTEDLVAYAGLNFALLEGALKNRIAYGYTRADRDYHDPAQAATTTTFDAAGESRRLEYQGVWAMSEAWTATFGAESEESEMRAAAPSAFDPAPVPARAEAGLDSAYLQVQGVLASGLTLTAGVRRDSHEAFGDHTLGQVAAAWSLNEGNTILRASFGQGFKAPTLYQLYSDYGNAGLAPEEADSWDAGIEQRLLDGVVVVSATWFNRESENLIDYVSCFGSASPLCVVNGFGRYGYYDNIARAKAQGIELTAAAQLGRLALNANYSWTDAENASPGANHGKRLARRPEAQANLAATYVWSVGLSTTVAIRHVGESFDNAGNTYRLHSHTLLDLRASYPLTGQIEVFGRVDNAFDDDYETVRNYGSIGRGVFVGARAKF